MAQDTYDYDVAVSFAGEDRHLVEPIVEKLKRNNVSVFYDRHEAAKMWGKDGQADFTDVFLKQARFCVMFISYQYAEKMWPNVERRAAMARSIQQKTEYILPVRLDNTDVEGLLPTINYLSYREYGADGIVEQLLMKLDLGKEGVSSVAQPSAAVKSLNFHMPKLKKEFSQREKDVFVREGFEMIRQSFEVALKQLEQHDPEAETEIEVVHRAKFLCRVYVKGEIGNVCKIWLGGHGGRGHDDHINYHEGDVSRDNDNSTSDSISVESDGHRLGFGRGYGFGSTRSSQDEGLRTAAQVAEYLWKRFTARLEA